MKVNNKKTRKILQQPSTVMTLNERKRDCDELKTMQRERGRGERQQQQQQNEAVLLKWVEN